LTVPRRSSCKPDTTLFGRLLEVLPIQVLRWKISAGSTTGPGFARALQDPGLGRAIAAMHHNPGYNGSLERLAAAGVLSRSALSRRFAELTGTLRSDRVAGYATLAMP
jgi:AraC-like DNA-binding protein